MRFYPFDVGDYRQDTAHLTLEEHYAYRYLLDECYLTEKPLSEDKRVLMRKLRLTPGQEWVVDNVLLDFFVSTDAGYIHPRVEAEIAEYKGRSQQATDAINTRWARVKAAKNTVRSNSSGNTDVIRPYNDRNTDVIPIEEVKKLRTKKDTTTSSSPAGPTEGPGKVPVQAIVDAWNTQAAVHGMVKCLKITTTLRGQIRQRWSDMDTQEKWNNFFDHIGMNDFLAGRARPGPGRSKPFRCSLLWATKETNFTKIAQGEYD